MLIIGSPISFFSLKIITIINTSLYSLTGALLSFTQIYSLSIMFLYRLNKLLWFIILIFKPKSRIIDFSKGYIS